MTVLNISPFQSPSHYAFLTSEAATEGSFLCAPVCFVSSVLEPSLPCSMASFSCLNWRGTSRRTPAKYATTRSCTRSVNVS